jgi:hypothetical protein
MKTKHILPIAFIALLLSACEKVVYIDLRDSTSNVVVEANVMNGNGPFKVTLSRSVNYYDLNQFPVVTGANVVLYDNDVPETLSETTPGEYKTSTTIGHIGHTYKLKINALDKEYLASSTMPTPVSIDTLTISLAKNNGHSNGPLYRITCQFKDPDNQINFYRVTASRNDSVVTNGRIALISDKLSDGQELSANVGGRYMIGDTVTVRLYSIDRVTYDFYNTLSAVEGDRPSFLSAPPANPTNNISNGGLGYFAAYSIASKKIVIH